MNAWNGGRRKTAAAIEVPRKLPTKLPAPGNGEKGASPGAPLSTQEAFGRILFDLAATDGALAERIVTTSPDVTQSTNLGGWVNRRGIFARDQVRDTFRDHHVASVQKWAADEHGQHIELGIAENNLFLMLGALGFSHELFAERPFPIGTVYHPSIQRAL